jgi:hypothetical protein
MFKHYVKVALRLIKRSFLFSSINILGLVLGMTAAFLIYLWIVDELTFSLSGYRRRSRPETWIPSTAMK